MHQLITSTNMTMNSREIAELVESRHDDVKRSIERLANKGVFQLPPMAEISTATKPVQVYVFSGEQGKLDSITVVAQLSPQFTAALVKRWHELESSRTAISTDPLIASLQALQIVRQQQIDHDHRLTLLEAKTITRDESYFTAAGFCNLKGIKLYRAGMAMIGKMASSFSRDNNLKVGKVYDSRYGEVNEYHVSALQHAVEA